MTANEKCVRSLSYLVQTYHKMFSNINVRTTKKFTQNNISTVPNNALDYRQICVSSIRILHALVFQYKYVPRFYYCDINMWPCFLKG